MEVSQTGYKNSYIQESHSTKKQSQLVQENQQPVMSLEQIKKKYNLQDITPKQIDALVKDLRENNLASFEQLMMLSTQGYEFRSHLPGGGGGNKGFNLIQSMEYQLTLSKRHGSPTETLERQLEFVKSLVDKDANHTSNNDTSSGGSIDPQWLDKMLQKILDSRVGIDRDKLEEIEKKIKAIENDKSIDAETKAKLIEALEQQKEELIQKAAEEMVEKEKQMPSLNVNELEQNQTIIDALNQDKLLNQKRAPSGSDKKDVYFT